MINRKFENLDGEIWVNIFRDYEISNMGRVVSNKGKWPRIMRTYKTWRKYHIVHLRINGIRKAFTIHRLVALIFNKNLDPKKKEVNHLFSKDDNRSTSLSWVTQKENTEHAIKNKLYAHGSSHHNTTLDEVQVITIKSLKGFLRQNKIANYFKISRSSVGLIQQNKVWAHL